MSAPAMPSTHTPAATAGSRDPSGPFLIAALAGLGVAGAGLALGLIEGDARPVLSWLIGISYWFSILIGMLLLVMISYLFDAGWSTLIRRPLEHAIGGFKWLALLFVPLLLLPWLYSTDPGLIWTWMNEANPIPGGGTVGEDPLYHAKSLWLNTGFWTFRTLFAFGVLVLVAEMLRRASFRNDVDPQPAHFTSGRRWSAFGVIATALMISVVSIDWFKTLEYHWFSTMYGVWFFAASMWSGIAATVLLMFTLEKGSFRGLVKPAHIYFLGCMLLAFTVFWAYISFSQYFLIYNANIPEETFWYNIREKNPDGSLNAWWWVSMVLIFGHFLLPFLYLLFYKNKFGARIRLICGWILAMHLIDLYFNILPGKLPAPEAVGGYEVRSVGLGLPLVFDLAMIIGVGGLLAWAFLRSSRETKLIPVNDPRILESLQAHE